MEVENTLPPVLIGLKEDYLMLDWTKAKKWKQFFGSKIENAKQFDCQAFDFESTLENLSV